MIPLPNKFSDRGFDTDWFCAKCGSAIGPNGCCGLKNDAVVVELGLANKVWCSEHCRKESLMKAIKDAYAQNAGGQRP